MLVWTSGVYDTDFYAWTQAQAQALQAKDWPALGIKHLAQEIVALGSNQRYAIQSPLERLLVHLLKYRDDPAQRPRRSWCLTIRHARREVTKHLGDSSSLGDHPTRSSTPRTGTPAPMRLMLPACRW
jgi:hypothetical protein